MLTNYSAIQIVFLLLTTFLVSLAQADEATIDLNGIAVSDSTASDQSRNFDVFELNIKRKDFKKPKAKSNGPSFVRLKLKLDKKTWNIKLYESELLTDVTVQNIAVNGILPPLTYYGQTNKGGEVRLSIHDDFMYGYIEDADGIHYLEPACYIDTSFNRQHFALYSSSDSALINSNNEDLGLSCGTSFSL